jgi:hypothetical protein
MSSKKDWLQSNHEKLYNQANATVDYLTLEVLTRIGIIGASYEWYNTEFIPKHGAFSTSFVKRGVDKGNPRFNYVIFNMKHLFTFLIMLVLYGRKYI